MCNGSMRQWVLLVALAFFQGRARIARSMRSSASYGRVHQDRCAAAHPTGERTKIDAQQRILRESARQDRCAAAHPTGVRSSARYEESALQRRAQQHTLPATLHCLFAAVQISKTLN
jgi:hypothetical protein